MARTIRVRDFIHSVLTTLQDVSPAYTRWTEVELVRYINLGQRAIASYVPHAGSRVDSIQLSGGTRQDLTIVPAARIKTSDGSTAVDTYGISIMNVVRNMGTDGQTPGKVIRKVDSYTLDTVDEDWHTRTGTPRKFISDGKSPRTFWVSPGAPAPATPTWVEVQWIAEPARVPDGGAPGAELYLVSGTSTQLLGINDDFEDDLRNYVIGMALMKGSKNEVNTQKAALHTAAFTNSINAKATVIGGVNPALVALPYVDAGATQAGG